METTTPTWFAEPTLGRRLAARLLDGLVLAPAVALGLLLDPWARLVFVGMINGAYDILLVARDGQTLGKRWMGLRVVTIDGGHVPTLEQAAMRWVVPEVASVGELAVGGLGLLLSLAVYLPVLKGPLHRGLHDHAAGTVVTASRR